MTTAQTNLTRNETEWFTKHFDVFDLSTHKTNKSFSELLNSNLMILVGDQIDERLDHVYKKAIMLFGGPVSILLEGPDNLKIPPGKIQRLNQYPSGIEIGTHQAEPTPMYVGPDQKASFIRHANLKCAKAYAIGQYKNAIMIRANLFVSSITKLLELGQVTVENNRLMIEAEGFASLNNLWSSNVSVNEKFAQLENAQRELAEFEAHNIERSAAEKIMETVEKMRSAPPNPETTAEVEATYRKEKERQEKLVPLAEKVHEAAKKGHKTVFIISEKSFNDDSHIYDGLHVKGLKHTTLFPSVEVTEKLVPQNGDVLEQLELVTVQVYSKFNVDSTNQAFYMIPQACVQSIPAPIARMIHTPSLILPITLNRRSLQKIAMESSVVFPAGQIVRFIDCDDDFVQCYRRLVDSRPKEHPLPFMRDEAKKEFQRMQEQHRRDALNQILFAGGVGLKRFKGDGSISYEMKRRDQQWGLEISSTRAFSLDLTTESATIDVESFFKLLNANQVTDYQIEQGNTLVFTHRSGKFSFYSDPVSQIELESFLTHTNLNVSSPEPLEKRVAVEIKGPYTLNLDPILNTLSIKATKDVTIRIRELGANAFREREAIASQQLLEAVARTMPDFSDDDDNPPLPASPEVSALRRSKRRKKD